MNYTGKYLHADAAGRAFCFLQRSGTVIQGGESRNMR